MNFLEKDNDIQNEKISLLKGDIEKINTNIGLINNSINFLEKENNKKIEDLETKITKIEITQENLKNWKTK